MKLQDASPSYTFKSVYQPVVFIMLIIHLLSLNFDDLLQDCSNGSTICDTTLS